MSADRQDPPGDDRDKPAEPARPHRFHKGRGSRFLRVASLATRVSGSYLGQKLKKAFVSEERAGRSLQAAHLRNADRVARTFGELKGAIMKVGQMMSLYADILPPEYTRSLASLQKRAPAIRFTVIRRQLEAGLGRDPDEVFAELDPVPFASASVGQVHRGRLADGREVAVKVQYPGVERTVDSDVKNLRMLIRSIGLLGEERGVDELIAEIQARLDEELDYRIERGNQEHFRAALADDQRVVIPATVAELTSRQVLVSEYLPGRDFAAVCAGDDQAGRDRIGQVMFDVLLRQLFGLRALHADPNPANYAFLADGRVVIYDFGCVRYYEPPFVEAYAELIRETLAGRYQDLEHNLARIGVRAIGGKQLPTDLFASFAEPVMEPFRVAEYDFGQSRIHEAVMRLGLEHWQDGLKLRAPPEIVFLDRVIVGMYNNLRLLGARGPWARILEPHLSTAAAGG